jgi:hypothetical protein
MAFNEIMDKVRDTIGTVADKTKDIAGVVADKAKDTTRIAKLNFEISSERDTIKKAYIEIGKIYYESHKDNPDVFFAQLCSEIDLALERIRDKEAEIATLKAQVDDGSIDVEFEHIVAESEESCACESDAAQEESCCCGDAPSTEETCCSDAPAAEEGCCDEKKED